MAHTVADKAVCGECGVEVRANTYFCYNCGKKVDGRTGDESQFAELSGDDASIFPVEKPDILLEAPPSSKINSDGKAALNHLAEKISIDRGTKDEKARAEAAVRRRKARSVRRKGSEFIWERVDDPPGWLLYAFSGVIVLLTAIAVVITVIWK